MQKSSVIKAALLGGALALGSALSGAASRLLPSPQVQTATSGSGKAKGKSTKARPRSFWYRKVCTSSQKTRNPADPQQAYLIERAKAKRAHRAEKLTIVATFAYVKNDAHSCSPAVNPFHIAK